MQIQSIHALLNVDLWFNICFPTALTMCYYLDKGPQCEVTCPWLFKRADMMNTERESHGGEVQAGKWTVSLGAISWFIRVKLTEMSDISFKNVCITVSKNLIIFCCHHENNESYLPKAVEQWMLIYWVIPTAVLQRLHVWKLVVNSYRMLNEYQIGAGSFKIVGFGKLYLWAVGNSIHLGHTFHLN